MSEPQMETIVVNGELIPAARMDIVNAVEPWAEIVLVDGTVLRHRTVISAVFWVPALSEPGRPHFVIVKSEICDSRLGTQFAITPP